MNLKSVLFVLSIAGITALLPGCQQENSAQDTSEADTGKAVDIEETPAAGLPYLVEYDEAEEKFELSENLNFQPVELEEIQEALELKYPEIPLEIERVESDTLYVSLPQSQYLTQSIGTSGATAYLVEATWGFTSIAPVRVVHFSFLEGDHASPGFYSRDSFEDFFKAAH